MEDRFVCAKTTCWKLHEPPIVMPGSNSWMRSGEPISKHQPETHTGPHIVQMSRGHNQGVTMLLRTIWTLPTLPLSERLRRTRDWSAQQVAAALPLRVRYWVTLAEIGKATMSSENVPATPLDEILHNLATPKSMS